MTARAPIKNPVRFPGRGPVVGGGGGPPPPVDEVKWDGAQSTLTLPNQILLTDNDTTVQMDVEVGGAAFGAVKSLTLLPAAGVGTTVIAIQVLEADAGMSLVMGFVDNTFDVNNVFGTIFSSNQAIAFASIEQFAGYVGVNSAGDFGAFAPEAIVKAGDWIFFIPDGTDWHVYLNNIRLSDPIFNAVAGGAFNAAANELVIMGANFEGPAVGTVKTKVHSLKADIEAAAMSTRWFPPATKTFFGNSIAAQGSKISLAHNPFDPCNSVMAPSGRITNNDTSADFTVETTGVSDCFLVGTSVQYLSNITDWIAQEIELTYMNPVQGSDLQMSFMDDSVESADPATGIQIRVRSGDSFSAVYQWQSDESGSWVEVGAWNGIGLPQVGDRIGLALNINTGAYRFYVVKNSGSPVDGIRYTFASGITANIPTTSEVYVRLWANNEDFLTAGDGFKFDVIQEQGLIVFDTGAVSLFLDPMDTGTPEASISYDQDSITSVGAGRVVPEFPTDDSFNEIRFLSMDPGDYGAAFVDTDLPDTNKRVLSFMLPNNLSTDSVAIGLAFVSQASIDTAGSEQLFIDDQANWTSINKIQVSNKDDVTETEYGIITDSGSGNLSISQILAARDVVYSLVIEGTSWILYCQGARMTSPFALSGGTFDSANTRIMVVADNYNEGVPIVGGVSVSLQLIGLDGELVLFSGGVSTNTIWPSGTTDLLGNDVTLFGSKQGLVGVYEFGVSSVNTYKARISNTGKTADLTMTGSSSTQWVALSSAVNDIQNVANPFAIEFTLDTILQSGLDGTIAIQMIDSGGGTAKAIALLISQSTGTIAATDGTAFSQLVGQTIGAGDRFGMEYDPATGTWFVYYKAVAGSQQTVGTAIHPLEASIERLITGFVYSPSGSNQVGSGYEATLMQDSSDYVLTYSSANTTNLNGEDLTP